MSADLGVGVESRGSVRLRRPNRLQTGLVVECVDDLVGPDHPVRAVMKVVEGLDLSAFHAPIEARAGVAGRDATDPALLVGLWLYACTRGVGSARELARRCEESAAFRWLCGGVGVNHRLLSEFRVGHATALDALFTRVIALLVDKDVVRVSRISQDGVRVRVGAGAGSFRREERLKRLLGEAREHVRRVRQQLDQPASVALSKRQRGARLRAAEERKQRLEQAVAELPELLARQEEAAQRAGHGKVGQKIRARQPRVSTTDAGVRVMKMPNGGFNPAVNVQLATDTASRAIVGVQVSAQGVDSADLSRPMRVEVERRTGRKVRQHLLDGGYHRTEDIEQAHAEEVELFLPPKTARLAANRGRELRPKPGDSPAILAWKRRMASQEGTQIYKQRASTSETVNADLRTNRGLSRIPVRGLKKAQCVALWCALAYNVMHFAPTLLG
jgi:transposase